MAAEFQQALKETGGITSICDLCRPSIEGHTPHLGLQDQTAFDEGVNKIKLSNKLSDISANALQCWVCAWLLLLLKNRRHQSFAEILQDDYDKVTMGIEPHRTYAPKQGRAASDIQGDRMTLILISVHVHAPSIERPFDYFLLLQQGKSKPLHLSALLDQAQSLEWPEHIPYEARIRPPQADLRLCKRWKDHCSRFHKGVCDTTKIPDIETIRLVDVKQKCIVHLPVDVPWVALSYCWGGPQVHSLKKDNADWYTTPGALTEDILPPVIFDALAVTEKIDERYIWIDSLCIIQDDELDKAKYLSVMDAIYAFASLTIVNAASGDTSAGLPGVREPTNRRIQTPFELNGTWVTESFDPGHSTFGGYLDSCTWSTRGWTFQEGILSRRCLIFTPEQIYWQCPKSSWCEASFWERSDELQVYRHFHYETLFTSITSSVVEDWTPLYTTIIKKYVQRDFTTESDVMHGLTGVLKVLTQLGGEEYLWGLPKSVLEHALTWTSEGPPIRREAQHKYVDSSGKLVSCPFPSWSWVGWQSKEVNVGNAGSSPAQGTLNLRFFYLDESGKPTPIQKVWPAPLPSESYGGTSQTTGYPVTAIHPWLDTTRQSVTVAEIPTSISSSPLAPSLLCFWTSVSTLKIEQRGWNSYWNEPHIVLSDPDGNVEIVGRWTPGDFDQSQRRSAADKVDLHLPESGKFIVVEAVRQRMSHGGSLTLTLIMVVDGELDGKTDPRVCRRRYIIREVLESQWEKLQEAKKWELVLMY